VTVQLGIDRENATAALAPYLPKMVVDWLAAEPDATWRVVDGSMAFVDISGFTKLSERLARQGKVGGEELADTIGACFTGLLAVAYAQGGGLLKFGGDALLLLFTGAGHELRACRAAADMRKALRQLGRLEIAGQQVLLRMSVGVHSGDFHLFLVGDSHRELLIAGPAATATVTMEGTAEAGEILVSQRTAAALRPGMLGAPKGDGVLLRRARAESSVDLTDRTLVPAGLDLTIGVPVAIRRSLLVGVHQAEHRRVTVSFVHFDGTDEVIEQDGAAETARRLHALVSATQQCVERHEITFLATDIDRDGGKIILTAGAPVASGDDERRMLLALRELIEGGVDLPVRIGVNRGDVFAGDIGPPYRRTYTVMGDTVNLAARVMSKAEPGEILATEGVLERSPTRFETTALAPFMVKGKAKPVQAFGVGPVLGAKTTATVESLPLVGREAELAALLAAVASLDRNRGAVAEIVGEPGLGKSRLVEELRRQAAGVVQLSVTCETYESSTPYYAFRGLVRGLLGLGLRPGEGDAAEIFDALRAVAPELLVWAPLVGMVVDVAIEESRETASLEERFRRDRLGEVMRVLLGHLLPAPTVFMFEDAHWMDGASADLLHHLSEGIQSKPWLICATRRDVAGGFVALPGAMALRLAPLAGEEAARLAVAATASAPIAPHHLAALTERSGGNPLFLKELLAAIDATDGLEALPDSVEALITARIDHLSPDDRNLLRRLSVLGQRFPVRLLGAVLDPVPEEGDDVWARVGGFIRPDSEGVLTFDHALVRDAAYEGLPYRLRRALHARAGDAIEEALGTQADEQAEVLSLHYLHAQRHAEAWKYALVAAERATSMYANVEAAEFYERAIEASRHMAGRQGSVLGNVYERLGEARERTGAYAKAEAAYRAARARAGDDEVIEARLLLRLAGLQGLIDRYARGLRWITMGLRRLEGVEAEGADRQRARLIAAYGQFCMEEGHAKRAITWCRRAIEAAELASDLEAEAQARKVYDWALADLGQLETTTNSLRALALYEELGHLEGQAIILSNLGVIAYREGRWNEAIDLWQRSAELEERIGDSVGRALVILNVVEVQLDQGRVTDAETALDEAFRVLVAAGHRKGVMLAKLDLAIAAYLGGRYEDGVRLLEEATAEAHELGAHMHALEGGARLAECLLVSGDAAGARAEAEATLDKARSSPEAGRLRPLLLRVRGVAAQQLGDPSAALDDLQQSLRSAQERDTPFDVALSLHALARLASTDDPGPQEDLLAQSQEILDQLGVLSVR
jgi:predicted ATPase/class 3 adenylate cyclase